MALKKTVTTPQGFTATDAYHRVEDITISTRMRIATGGDQFRELRMVSFTVRSYKESGAAAFNETRTGAEYDMDGANPIAQAYAHLKTLPEFADAVDC